MTAANTEYNSRAAYNRVDDIGVWDVGDGVVWEGVGDVGDGVVGGRVGTVWSEMASGTSGTVS